MGQTATCLCAKQSCYWIYARKGIECKKGASLQQSGADVHQSWCSKLWISWKVASDACECKLYIILLSLWQNTVYFLCDREILVYTCLIVAYRILIFYSRFLVPNTTTGSLEPSWLNKSLKPANKRHNKRDITVKLDARHMANQQGWLFFSGRIRKTQQCMSSKYGRCVNCQTLVNKYGLIIGEGKKESSLETLKGRRQCFLKEEWEWGGGGRGSIEREVKMKGFLGGSNKVKLPRSKEGWTQFLRQWNQVKVSEVVWTETRVLLTSREVRN